MATAPNWSSSPAFATRTIDQPRPENFGPRVALAYDPFKSGKTVIRVGAGLFYNRALLRTIDDFTLGRQQLLFDTSLLTNSKGQLFTLEEEQAFIAENLTFPKVLAPDSSLVKERGLLATNFSRRLIQAFASRSYQANIGFDARSAALCLRANSHQSRPPPWRDSTQRPRFQRVQGFYGISALARFPNFRRPDGTRRSLTDGAGDQVLHSPSIFQLRPSITHASVANPIILTSRVLEESLPITLSTSTASPLRLRSMWRSPL